MATYVSLFSSAGVGDFGFKQEKFDCIATNEFIPRRLEVQKANNKCLRDSGYVEGDIQQDEVKNKIFNEIKWWQKNKGVKNVDVVIATPPCQGMSVANLKKNKKDINRNSLVIEAIEMIIKIKPNFFVIENVPSFLNTACIDNDGQIKSIDEAIDNHLSDCYNIAKDVINFKNYGVNSSRTRTLVIGIRKEFSNDISPFELMPTLLNDPKPLSKIIGHFKSLKNMNEYDENNLLHRFRAYRSDMRSWIHDLKQGENAFDNVDINNKPHHFNKNGETIPNVNKNGDKYKRQLWNEVGPCIHTRNDQLASQNTIHPEDDRVFSIAELMELMNIPKIFRWSKEKLNKDNVEEFYKKNEMNIRQCIGEAVPTSIFENIAKKIKQAQNSASVSRRQIETIIKKFDLENFDNMSIFFKKNKGKYLASFMMKICELANPERKNNCSFFTNQMYTYDLLNKLPDFKNQKTIKILEPSSGAGNFIPMIFLKYRDKTNVKIILNDMDNWIIKCSKLILKIIKIPKNFSVVFKNDDFLNLRVKKKFDLIIGNPPFGTKGSKTYLDFINKAMDTSLHMSFVLPKYFLNAAKDSQIRNEIKKYHILSISDYGNRAFKDAKIETINLICDLSRMAKASTVTYIYDLTSSNGDGRATKQAYITDGTFPNWLIYRNGKWDSEYSSLETDQFQYYRNRSISKKSITKTETLMRVIKGKDIEKGNISYKENLYLKEDLIMHMRKELPSGPYLYVVPNMTYIQRCAPLPEDSVPDGSAAIIWLKDDGQLSTKDIDYLCSDKFSQYIEISRNCSRRTINIDRTSIVYYGTKRKRY